MRRSSYANGCEAHIAASYSDCAAAKRDSPTRTRASRATDRPPEKRELPPLFSNRTVPANLSRSLQPNSLSEQKCELRRTAQKASVLLQRARAAEEAKEARLPKGPLLALWSPEAITLPAQLLGHHLQTSSLQHLRPAKPRPSGANLQTSPRFEMHRIPYYQK